MQMPSLETARLRIRPFRMDDLEGIHQLLDVELVDAEVGTEGALMRQQRREWLQWTVLNYAQLALLYQPPYGDRAVVLKETNELIGACGFAPALAPFGQLPWFVAMSGGRETRRDSSEFGLYWAIAPSQQRRGYATEAGRALIDYGFTALRLARVVATTTFENEASIGVMRKLGMHIEHNPYPDPPWLQIVGVLEHPEERSA